MKAKYRVSKWIMFWICGGQVSGGSFSSCGSSLIAATSNNCVKAAEEVSINSLEKSCMAYLCWGSGSYHSLYHFSSQMQLHGRHIYGVMERAWVLWWSRVGEFEFGFLSWVHGWILFNTRAIESSIAIDRFRSRDKKSFAMKKRKKRKWLYICLSKFGIYNLNVILLF